jgi:hypothetical protein
MNLEKIFDLSSISARESEPKFEGKSRKTPHHGTFSVNVGGVSRNMAVRLSLGR